MKPKVFIDGAEGTTGLEIREKLSGRDDLEVLEIGKEVRKDAGERRRLLNEADVAILCLPDEAARESVGMVENPGTRILDASTAHRTAAGWVYGLPEIGLREEIREARRVAVCGCHATAFVLAVRPLVLAGLISADAEVTAISLTGYSGGGRRLIAAFEGGGLGERLGVGAYALGLRHKHLPEMRKYAGLSKAPLFQPVVGNFARGLLVAVFFYRERMARGSTLEAVREVLQVAYGGERFIRVVAEGEGLEEGFLSPQGCNGTNRVDLFVFGNQEQLSVMARLDNLGKGASGGAIQCLNLMLGLPEERGLSIWSGRGDAEVLDTGEVSGVTRGAQ